MDSPDPFAPPQTPLTAEESEHELGEDVAGAGFGIRAAARIIDQVLSLFFASFISLLNGAFGAVLTAAGVLREDWLERAQAFTWTSVIAGFGAAMVHYTLVEGIGGASPGKLLLKLRVIGEDGRPCTFRQAFVRQLATFIDFFFFGLVAKSAMDSSALNQRYGDRWAGALVVRAEQVPGASRRSVGAVLLALFLGFTATAVLQTIEFFVKAM